MKTLNVELGNRSYPIYIGADIINNALCINAMKECATECSSIVIVTNQTINALHGEKISTFIKEQGKESSLKGSIVTIELPDGEIYKNWETLQLIFNRLIEIKADRKTLLVALGGGVIGDITGFAAATYMRGVPFIQIPTSLLAQVDSSVGGKTGINHPKGKNMIGAFYQPQCVMIDTLLLKTLPEREYLSGLAEIIKTAAIADAEFFYWLENNMSLLIDKESNALAYAIEKTCAIKATVVAADEKEKGLRAILNFGHTFGHAIETSLGYGTWLHGEAVACGMAMAADLSMRLNMLNKEINDRLIKLITQAKLPINFSSDSHDLVKNEVNKIRTNKLNKDNFIDLMKNDKKAEQGEIKFVLLLDIGKVEVKTVSMDFVRKTLENFMD